MAFNLLSKGPALARALIVGAPSSSGLKNPPAAGIDPVKIGGIYLVSASVNPGASIAAGTTFQGTVTLTGVQAGDAILVMPPAALPAGLGADAWASAANTVTVTLQNVTAGSITTSSQTWQFLWFKLAPNF